MPETEKRPTAAPGRESASRSRGQRTGALLARRLCVALLTPSAVAYAELSRLLDYQAFAPFLLIFIAVVLSAALEGFWVGLAAGLVASGFTMHAWLVSFGPQALIGSPAKVAFGCAAYLAAGVILGRITDDRNSFLAKLQSSRARLKELSARLDEKVAQRTRKIIAVNDQLKRSEKRFSSLIRSLPDAILTVKTDGRIGFCNDQATRLFGYSREELMGLHVNELVPEALRERHSENMSAYHENASPRRMGRELTFTAVRKDGSGVPVEIGLSPLETSEGRFVICVLRDVTDVVEAQRELRQSEAKYRVIVESAHEGILVLDTEAKVTYANPRMAEILGYEPGGLIGRTTFELTDDAGREEIARRLERRREGLTELYDFRYTHRDGSDIWVLIAATPLTDKDGEFTGSLLMVADVTERRRLEGRLRHAQKMDVVGQLTGGIAHDFNNMLTIMIGNLELLDRLTEDDEQLSALVRAGLGAGLRGEALTRRLLAFSRKDALRPERCDIRQIIEGLDPLVRQTLGEHISIEISCPEAPETIADKSQLENALVNLVVNARDAMPQGGALSVQAGIAVLDAAQAANIGDIAPGKYAMLTVTDSGQGMSPELLDKVFEPFFTTKESGKGTGLGLAMVYDFVKGSNGSITIESQLGKGTTVRLYLPASQPAADPTDPTAARSQLGDASCGETILVVEDDPAVRCFVVAALEGLEYRVIAAETGREGLEVLKQRDDIDLLFTDIVMPGGMTGIELASHALAREPDLKVLFTSGYIDSAQFSAKQSAVTLTADNLLAKPYRIPDLARKLREILDADALIVDAKVGSG